ncbi:MULTISPECIES: APC family permease [Brenneria]|uniref:APC family permease n=1 Tax=Brenneria nigrifluens DSM 30175 = ATCC 13028 TaxID=1121120 RepID=A0A2U1ULH5_9GAMM|nr:MULTISPECIES: APC family permease [Brenneria]EHD19559.1 amino acid permease-associated region [Brenneria sp. EniD312]PWC22529.1 APC family permease [Brenneria nigrifluens] [Brenneria nigrifluens DSM 30175 = ATCC 13028]QCR02830.1 APC family permease [Brenneria nigrifluens] [Brenneria nigrifluens DSM 30175 = ATCC 13028]
MAQSNQLQKGSLGLWSIIFFVIAAASPLTGVIGGLPVAFMAGNGAGVPGVYVLAGVLLFVFSFGFIAMSRYVVNAGAFYAYIAQGLGARSGIAGLGIALLAYTAIQLAVTAMFGFFCSLFLEEQAGIAVPWWLFSLAMQALVVSLGIAKVELGGKVLGILMLLEVGIVLLADAAILTQPIAFDLSSFSPSTVFHGDVGIAMIFAICSFVGFEATAIYSEECRDPRKIIPRATLLAVTLITAFFALTGWAFVQYVGSANIAEVVAKDPGMFIFSVTESVLGSWAIHVMSLLLLTSLFAAAQAFHNTLSRYLFAISRDGLLWSKMAKTHPAHQTPYVASIVQGGFMLSSTALFALARLDPMAHVFSWASALGSMSILLLQFSVSVAVIVYFLRQASLPVSWWSRLIAPVIAAAGMLAALVMVIGNLDVLSGSSSPVVSLLPYLVLIVALSGFVGAHFLSRLNPERYSKVGQIVESL